MQNIGWIVACCKLVGSGVALALSANAGAAQDLTPPQATPSQASSPAGLSPSGPFVATLRPDTPEERARFLEMRAAAMAQESAPVRQLSAPDGAKEGTQKQP